VLTSNEEMDSQVATLVLHSHRSCEDHGQGGEDQRVFSFEIFPHQSRGDAPVRPGSVCAAPHRHHQARRNTGGVRGLWTVNEIEASRVYKGYGRRNDYKRDAEDLVRTQRTYGICCKKL